MSDDRLRELERKWAETGAVEDEAAVLRECLRVGSLTARNLELATCVGSEAAHVALGNPVEPLPLPDEYSETPAWVQWVPRFGRTTCARVAIAIGRCVAPVWMAFTRDDVALGCISRVEQLVACPCAPHANRHSAGIGTADHLFTWALPSDVQGAVDAIEILCGFGSAVAHTAGLIALKGDLGRDAHFVAEQFRAAQRALAGKRDEAEVSRVLFEAVRADVLPWALRRHDPLSDRVEDRPATLLGYDGL